MNSTCSACAARRQAFGVGCETGDPPARRLRRLVVDDVRSKKLLKASSGSFERCGRDVVGEDGVDLAGDVALEAAEDVEVGFPSGERLLT